MVEGIHSHMFSLMDARFSIMLDAMQLPSHKIPLYSYAKSPLASFSYSIRRVRVP